MISVVLLKVNCLNIHFPLQIRALKIYSLKKLLHHEGVQRRWLVQATLNQVKQAALLQVLTLKGEKDLFQRLLGFIQMTRKDLL